MSPWFCTLTPDPSLGTPFPTAACSMLTVPCRRMSTAQPQGPSSSVCSTTARRCTRTAQPHVNVERQRNGARQSGSWARCWRWMGRVTSLKRGARLAGSKTTNSLTCGRHEAWPQHDARDVLLIYNISCVSLLNRLARLTQQRSSHQSSQSRALVRDERSRDAVSNYADIL